MGGEKRLDIAANNFNDFLVRSSTLYIYMYRQKTQFELHINNLHHTLKSYYTCTTNFMKRGRVYEKMTESNCNYKYARKIPHIHTRVIGIQKVRYLICTICHKMPRN